MTSILVRYQNKIQYQPYVNVLHTQVARKLSMLNINANNSAPCFRANAKKTGCINNRYH